MKIFRLFTIAAAALMLSACSEDIAQMINGGKKEFTATLAAPNKGGTRTVYTEDTQNNKIAVAWKVGDEIALVHDKVMDVVKVKTVNADGSATIDGTITSANDEAPVQLVYPAAAIELNNDKNPVPAAAYTEKMLAQDGTLSYIASNLDLRVGESTLAVDGDKATLSANVSLASQIAIWKLTLSDGTNNLSATQVKIKGGESVLASTTTLTSGTSVVTLAIPNVAIDGALTIEATVSDDTYAYTKAEGPTFNSGTYYQSTVTMAKAGWAANEYNEGSWDGTKVVFTKQKAASVTAVANSAAAVTWSAGWYTVSGNVTITGNVTLGADTHLILQDDATLTINGQLNCGTKNLYIYGQKKGDGKLNVTNNSDNAINSSADYHIDIHGGEVTAAATGDFKYGLFTGYLAVYGGKLTATSGGGDGISFYNTIDVYDGEVVATSNATSSPFPFYGISGGSSVSRILKVYGGKVTATGNGVDYAPNYGSGIGCYVWSATTGIKFYFSDNGTTWGYGYGYSIAVLVGTDGDTKKRYAKAE